MRNAGNTHSVVREMEPKGIYSFTCFEIPRFCAGRWTHLSVAAQTPFRGLHFTFFAANDTQNSYVAGHTPFCSWENT